VWRDNHALGRRRGARALQRDRVGPRLERLVKAPARVGPDGGDALAVPGTADDDRRGPRLLAATAIALEDHRARKAGHDHATHARVALTLIADVGDSKATSGDRDGRQQRYDNPCVRHNHMLARYKTRSSAHSSAEVEKYSYYLIHREGYEVWGYDKDPAHPAWLTATSGWSAGPLPPAAVRQCGNTPRRSGRR
jgi:hypothetical protein